MMKVVVDLDLKEWLDEGQLGEVIADEVRAAVRAEVRRMTKDAIAGKRPEWVDAIRKKVDQALEKAEFA